MSEIKETVIEHTGGMGTATFFSSEIKWINLIHKLKELYPDSVEIVHINSDGSMLVHIPVEWVKIKPKKKVTMTQEQIEASKARLEKGRMRRLGMIGDDDARVENGKEKDLDGS